MTEITFAKVCGMYGGIRKELTLLRANICELRNTPVAVFVRVTRDENLLCVIGLNTP